LFDRPQDAAAMQAVRRSDAVTPVSNPVEVVVER
jgi:hypothetical protein